MNYTQQDLLVAERTVRALEEFIREQERRFEGGDWDAQQRGQLDSLLQQFNQSLQLQRDKCQEIRAALQQQS